METIDNPLGRVPVVALVNRPRLLSPNRDRRPHRRNPRPSPAGTSRSFATRPPGTGSRPKRADALAARLVTAQAALTGKLTDPTDLPFTEDLLDDEGLVDDSEVQAAVDDLIKRKPHLAARRPIGDVGQGARPEISEMGLGALLRRGA